jgi:LCP family protein required for cell wall assembly
MTKRIRIAALVVVLGLASYLVAVPLLAWSKVSRVDAEPDGARPDEQPGTTYLLVGSDSRDELTEAERRRLHTGGAGGARADTVMLMQVGSGPSLLLSIPRASLVEVPGHGTSMVNAAYAYGGASLLVEAIERATGIRVDNYVEIGFSGVVRLVDAVGDITVCPKAAMDDRQANLHVSAGCQSADGRTALAYARSRHAQALDDLDRAAHQREVVSATGSQALSWGTVISPARYWRVLLGGAEAVTVGENVSAASFARFTWAMRRIDATSGLTCGVPITDASVSAVHWDPKRAARLFTLIKEDRTDAIDEDLCQPTGLDPTASGPAG